MGQLCGPVGQQPLSHECTSSQSNKKHFLKPQWNMSLSCEIGQALAYCRVTLSSGVWYDLQGAAPEGRN